MPHAEHHQATRVFSFLTGAGEQRERVARIMTTDMSALEEKVKDIIVEELGVKRERLAGEANFTEDLGADSLDTVELVMAFEEEFDIDISDEDAEELQTVGGALTYLHQKKGSWG